MRTRLLITVGLILLIGFLGTIQNFTENNFTVHAQIDFDSTHILETNSLNSGFFTDDYARISDYIFEVGREVKFQQRLDNNSTNSDQKGTLDFYFYRSGDQNYDDLLKTFDFDINPYTYEIFAIDYKIKQSGFFIIESVPIMDEPYRLGGSSFLFSVVDSHSKAYEKDNGCNENFRSLIKPDYSTEYV